MSDLHSLQAEQSVIGACLQDNSAFDAVGDIITHESFFVGQHRVLWRCIEASAVACKPFDDVTIFEAARRYDEELELSYLTAMTQVVPSARSARRYAEVVADYAVRRKMLSIASNAAADLAKSSDGKTIELAVAVCDSIDEAITNAKTHEPISTSAAVVAACDRITAMHEGGADQRAISTGLPAVDGMLPTEGLLPGQLVVLAGRPGMGKTALALNIADGVSANSNVIFFSGEMTEPELTDRRLAAKASIDSRRITSGRLSDDEWGRFSEAVDSIGKTRNLFVDDTPGPTIPHIRIRSKAIARRHGGLGLIVIDHLGLMTGGPSDNRNAEIGYYSRNLKRLAKELGCSILLLSQLNRGVEHRADKRPVLSDLRESGDIEQDADIVIFVHRPEYYQPDRADLDGYAEALFRKQRNGPTGDVMLRFQKAYQRFDTWDGMRPTVHIAQRTEGQRLGDF